MRKKIIIIFENGGFQFSGAKVRNDNLVNEFKNRFQVIRISLRWILFYEKNSQISISLWKLFNKIFIKKSSLIFMSDIFLVALLFPASMIFTVHDMKEWSKYGRRGKIKKYLFRLMSFKPGLKWVSISNFVKDKLKKELNINSEVISNSSGDLWFTKETYTQQNIVKTDNYALYVSNIAKHKGHIDILKIANQLPVDKVVIVGSISDNEGKNIYKNLFHHKKFILLKNIETKDLIKLVDNANLILFPSYYEGYGIPIGEAIIRNKKVYANQELKKYITNCNLISFIDFRNGANIKGIKNKSDDKCECGSCEWKLRWRDRAKKMSELYF